MEEFEEFESGLEGVEEVQLVVAEEVDPGQPFWRIGKEEFLPLLRTIVNIASRNSDAVSRSILLKEKDGYLHYTMTNRDVFLRGRMTLKNQENHLMDKVILSSKQLLEVAKFSADVVLYKKEDQMLASVMRGAYPLESFTFSDSIYNLETKPNYGEEVDMASIKMDLELFLRLMFQASIAEDKKIFIKNGYAYGLFISILSRLSIPYIDEKEELIIPHLMAKDLSALLSIYGKNVRLGTSKDRIFFRTPDFEYSALAIAGSVPEEVIGKFEDDDEGMLVDGNQLFNLFSFLSLSSSDSSVAEIKGGKEGMKLISRTKSGKTSEFSLIDIPVEKTSFKMQVNTAKKVFFILKTFPSIGMVKKGDTVVWSTETLKVIQSIRG